MDFNFSAEQDAIPSLTDEVFTSKATIERTKEIELSAERVDRELWRELATTGLLVEITQRRSWRQFLTPDLAADFGYVRPKRGRPAKEPPPLPVNRDLAAVFDAFDSEMAAIDNLLVRKSDPS